MIRLRKNCKTSSGAYKAEINSSFPMYDRLNIQWVVTQDNVTLFLFQSDSLPKEYKPFKSIPF